ncbi:MAG: F0F1 ATP synthase subunit B [Lachnospiraceae bacterium]|nr:F0F1 ATP synthase subunit B [Candidatus Darwinimomas equi]
MQTQDLVTIVPWTFIAQICNLFIQVFLIKKFLIKPIREVIAKRHQLATEELDKARVSEQEAQALKAEYEKNLSEARDKANEIISTANRTAIQKSDEIIANANREALAIRNKAENDIALERKAAVNDIKDEIGSMAVDIATRLIEREVNEEDHRKLIDEFIENVGESK